MLTLLLVAAVALSSPAPPAADGALPRSAPAVARQLQDVDAGLRTSLAAWQGGDPELTADEPPLDVQLWALRQQRLLIALRDDGSRARAVLARLDGALRRAVQSTLTAMTDLKRLAPAHPPKRRWKVGAALSAGSLLKLYRDAERRTGVGWHILAAVNLVESHFNKLRNESIVGAQGPMQFMPSTWATYGRGDVHDPRDAIPAAARFLRAAGAPASYSRALYRYNPSQLYVDAVLRYAHRIQRSRRAFLSYYAWQVFVREPSGRTRRLTGPH
ncbi:MAG TPA: transglycosylase SLT domain-containing protein [Thermoleophilaceae bacterium]